MSFASTCRPVAMTVACLGKANPCWYLWRNLYDTTAHALWQTAQPSRQPAGEIRAWYRERMGRHT